MSESEDSNTEETYRLKIFIAWYYFAGEPFWTTVVGIVIYSKRKIKRSSTVMHKTRRIALIFICISKNIVVE